MAIPNSVLELIAEVSRELTKHTGATREKLRSQQTELQQHAGDVAELTTQGDVEGATKAKTDRAELAAAMTGTLGLLRSQISEVEKAFVEAWIARHDKSNKLHARLRELTSKYQKAAASLEAEIVEMQPDIDLLNREKAAFDGALQQLKGEANDAGTFLLTVL